MTSEAYPTILAMITKKVVAQIAEAEQLTIFKAIEMFYQSKTYRLLADEKTKLWWFSPEMLFTEFCLEKGEQHV